MLWEHETSDPAVKTVNQEKIFCMFDFFYFPQSILLQIFGWHILAVAAVCEIVKPSGLGLAQELPFFLE